MGEPNRSGTEPERIRTLLQRVVPGPAKLDTPNVDRVMSYEPWAEHHLDDDSAATIDRQTERQFLTFVDLWGRQFQAAFSDRQTVLQLLSDQCREAITARLVERQKEEFRADSAEKRAALARIGIHTEDDMANIIRPSDVADTAARLLPAVVFSHHPDRKPEPRQLTCGFCDTRFVDMAQPHWLVRWTGPPRYCTRCLQRIHHFDAKAKPLFRKQELIDNLQHLTAVLGGPPPLNLIGRDAQSGRPLYRAEEPQQRHQLAAALMALPRFPSFIAKFRTSNWLDVLQAAGVIDGFVRRTRGTSVRAVDGTWMRSLAEKHVDDYLTSRGIAHEHEPAWPRHPTLNPFGQRRADWQLEDGTYVEYAGLVGDASYDRKIVEKVRLAEALNIPLIVLTEPDLLRLPAVLPCPPQSPSP